MTDKFLVGHAQDQEKGTGVTVILAPDGAVGGVSVRGAAPGTRETDLLKGGNTVDKINAVVLSGGSAFGLESCSGVMEYLREKGCGYKAGKYRVPIVCGAVLYDLEYKEFAYPDKQMGYLAAKNAAALRYDGGRENNALKSDINAENATEKGSINAENAVKKGNIGAGTFSSALSDDAKDETKGGGALKSYGAGTGATIGKILGAVSAAKSGLGIHTVKIGAIEITAIVAVNAVGDVYGKNGEIIAGARVGGKFADTLKILTEGAFGSGDADFNENNQTTIRLKDVSENVGGDDFNEKNRTAISPKDAFESVSGADFNEKSQTAISPKDVSENINGEDLKGKNTTIGCLLTNAVLTKEEANKLADIAHDGYAIAIRPVHTMFDGDTIFVMASGEKKCAFIQLCAAAVEATAAAIRDAVSDSIQIAENKGNLLKTAFGVWKQSKGK
jgi:L-aminopeptidase/D-esterase-like protein